MFFYTIKVENSVTSFGEAKHSGHDVEEGHGVADEAERGSDGSAGRWGVSGSLHAGDAEVIATGDLLNDRIIDEINRLVAEKMGTDPIQSTLIAQTPGGFDRLQTDAVIVLHDENHWITTARLDGRILYADSLTRPISAYIKLQMRQLYARSITVGGTLPVHMMPCDKQNNGQDCGVFAAAFAFDLATRRPSPLTPLCGYTLMSMRPHLMMCLTRGEALPFPRTQSLKRGRKPSPYIKNI